MPPIADSLLSLIQHDGDRALLAVLLLTSIGLTWKGREGLRSTGASALSLSAAGLLGTTLIGLIWAGMAGLFDVSRMLWTGPLDRLIALTSIVAVAWLVDSQGRAQREARASSAGSPDARASRSPASTGIPRWRKLLGGSFAAMLLTYLVWAPQWAMAFSEGSLSAQSQSTVVDIHRLWDASQAILALVIGGAILFGSGRSARPAVLVIGLLSTGSLMDLLAPSDPMHHAAAGARLGALLAGLALAGTAAAQRFDLGLGDRLPGRNARRDPAAPARGGSGYGIPDVLAALHGQTSSLSVLSDRLEALGERVDRLERRAHPDARPSPEARGDADRGEDPPVGDSELGRPQAARNEADGPAEASPLAPIDAPEGERDGLEARLARYQAVLGFLPLGLLMTDSSGRIAYANPSAERLLGREGGLEGLGLPQVFERAEGLHAGLRRALERQDGQAGPVSIEIEQPHLRLELFALRPPPEGELTGLLAVLDQHREPGVGLADDLVPDLAEGLRAPVNSILGYSQLLRKGSSLAENQVQRYLERIDANLARMQVMLENVATVLRAGSRAGDLPASGSIEMGDRLQRALERAKHQLDEKGLRVERQVDPELGRFDGPSEAIDQILDNLLLHAARRSPQGGDLRVEAGRIQDRGQACFALSVQDRGPAPIPVGREGQAELRVDELGFGLELRMVALLTRLHGGRAWAERHPLGSQVRVALPLGESERAQQ